MPSINYFTKYTGCAKIDAAEKFSILSIRTLTIIYLPRQLGGRIHPFRSLAKGVVLMYVTYDDLFTFVLMIVAIITLVKSFYDKRKK